MQHKIPVETLGPQGEVMAHAVEACVHCGFCLPACPTYRVLGEEMDSPRGRILLMKDVLEGELGLDEAGAYLDRCLSCLSCVTACPSGVPYGELIGAFRNWSEPKRRRPLAQRALRTGLQWTLPYPDRFRLAARLGGAARPLAPLLPKPLKAPLELLPSALPAAEALPVHVPAEGQRRARVALLAGCSQQVLAPAINRATLKVLARNGVEVLIPPAQGCCGALSMHQGARAQALLLARHNIKAFPRDVDAILTNAAGCGSGMKEYPLLFLGEPDLEEAEAFAAQVQDVTVFLDQLGLLPPPPLREPLRLAYHDACHLAHAQGIRSEPRRLLGQIAGLELLEIAEGQFCCGSAGTYNLEHSAIANDLGELKAQNILATEAQVVAAGNIGCIAQIQAHLRRLGSSVRVHHTLEVLELAYEGGL